MTFHAPEVLVSVSVSVSVEMVVAADLDGNLVIGFAPGDFYCFICLLTNSTIFDFCFYNKLIKGMAYIYIYTCLS